MRRTRPVVAGHGRQRLADALRAADLSEEVLVLTIALSAFTGAAWTEQPRAHLARTWVPVPVQHKEVPRGVPAQPRTRARRRWAD